MITYNKRINLQNKIVIFGICFSLLILINFASAKEDHLLVLRAAYPNSTIVSKYGCSICHFEDKATFNAYGADIVRILKLSSSRNLKESYSKIDILDSDKDGYPNLEEIELGSNPGDPNNFPSEKLFPGSFRFVYPLSIPRYLYAVTLLSDGRVLIIGGASKSFEVLNSVDIYDPKKNVTFQTSSMQYPRWSHTATLLPDGRVLICGGREGSKYDSPVLKECEIYDPKTGKFTLTDSMSVPRRSHTATLLKDGRVLICGGGSGTATFDGSDATDKCQIYDSKTNKFTEISPMHFPRQYHRATLLNDGRVLITGGSSKGTFDPSTQAEVYNPKTNQFTLVPSMHHERIIHASVLLTDGRVLLAGGVNPKNYEAREDAEIYDPKKNQFIPISPMHFKRVDIQGIRLNDGKVLIAGGSSLPFGPKDKAYFNPSAEIFDPVTGKFSFTSSMHTGRDAVMPIKLKDGRVFICGGMTSSSFDFTTLAEVYEPSSMVKQAKKPEPIVKLSTKEGNVPLDIEFNVESKGTKMATYLWRFGDGDESIGKDVKHKYTCTGVYKGKVMAISDEGEMGVAEFEVNVIGEKKEVSYRCDVKPIIDRRCLGCHGTRGGLTLATYEDIIKGGTKGKVIVPGDSKSSSLIDSVENGKMAVLSSLTPDEEDIVKKWIDEGAKNN